MSAGRAAREQWAAEDVVFWVALAGLVVIGWLLVVLLPAAVGR